MFTWIYVLQWLPLARIWSEWYSKTMLISIWFILANLSYDVTGNPPRMQEVAMVVNGFAVDLPGLEFASLNLNLTANRSQSAPLNFSAQGTELNIIAEYSWVRKNGFWHLNHRLYPLSEGGLGDSRSFNHLWERKGCWLFKPFHDSRHQHPLQVKINWKLW